MHHVLRCRWALALFACGRNQHTRRLLCLDFPREKTYWKRWWPPGVFRSFWVSAVLLSRMCLGLGKKWHLWICEDSSVMGFVERDVLLLILVVQCPFEYSPSLERSRLCEQACSFEEIVNWLCGNEDALQHGHPCDVSFIAYTLIEIHRNGLEW